MAPSTRNPRPRGFTLIEAALATVIIGVGMLSMMQLFAAVTQQNVRANRMTVGSMLTQHIQEAMAGLPFTDPEVGINPIGPESGETLASFDDADDFDGSTFSPPITALRRPIPELARFSQVITVYPILANDLDSNSGDGATQIPKTAYTGAKRVRVRVLYRAKPDAVPEEVYQLSWIKVNN